MPFPLPLDLVEDFKCGAGGFCGGFRALTEDDHFVDAGGLSDHGADGFGVIGLETLPQLRYGVFELGGCFGSQVAHIDRIERIEFRAAGFLGAVGKLAESDPFMRRGDFHCAGVGDAGVGGFEGFLQVGCRALEFGEGLGGFLMQAYPGGEFGGASDNEGRRRYKPSVLA